jgi:hypothetical protein
MTNFATMKHAVNELKVNPLDQVIYRNVLSGFVALIVALSVGETFGVRKDMRCHLLWRSVIGVTGNTAMTFGVPIVPLIY